MANRLFAPSNAQRLGKLGRGISILAVESTGANSAANRRDFSSQRRWGRKNTYVEQVLFEHSGEKQAQTIWPDPNLGCLGAKDSRFSLPGDVGLGDAVTPKEEDIVTPERLLEDKQLIEKEIAFWRNLCDSPTSYQRQVKVIKHHEEVERVNQEEMDDNNRLMKTSFDDLLECIAQPCPDLLRRELAGMFGSMNFSGGTLSVVTFCHRTTQDMTSWSPEVEEEREVLIKNFVKYGKDLCQELRNRGQWADFIDPTSGRPFFSPYTNITFFETDERYRHLGFRIVDLGCCKVIKHSKWGTHSFVGSIFTSAPHDSEYMEQILAKSNERMRRE